MGCFVFRGRALRVCRKVPWRMGEADMQCFEAISIFRVARCFRCHCHFLLGQTLGIHFRRRPLSTIESMPGQRHGVSKEKDEHFPFSRINQAAPDVAIFPGQRHGVSKEKDSWLLRSTIVRHFCRYCSWNIIKIAQRFRYCQSLLYKWRKI